MIDFTYLRITPTPIPKKKHLKRGFIMLNARRANAFLGQMYSDRGRLRHCFTRHNLVMEHIRRNDIGSTYGGFIQFQITRESLWDCLREWSEESDD